MVNPRQDSPGGTAPVQGEPRLGIKGGEVPFAVHALAAEEYRRRGHDQSAAKLAARGGFGWAELVACLRGEYTHEGCKRAAADLDRIVSGAEGA